MTQNETRRVTDLGTLKAFAHPLRMKLYRALSVSRTATVTQLADQVDEAVSLVSYHLRKLAEHGLIEEAERRGGDGRERWWQPVAEGLSFREEDFSDAPEKAAVHAAVGRMAFEERSSLFRSYLDSAASWPAEWRAAAFSTESLAPLTADELARLSEEMHAMVRRYKRDAVAAQEAGDTAGREDVALHLYAFPFRTR
ncbi:ArsR/SmtB family transcription factor [Streptomyces montanisoli]|uniref:Helix-turn-helix domain-containing protein n=1 Tax=Streptomyces montanisoli TaxID=2798581 RepID=A0A940MJK2_9ACTN|nr:helix-turn-helix domain-containing protein [Streptomyces montanisoli]MBP0459708.1 helix-turn-helix domain-containing protein [Streptomyces montanisoli]